MTYSNYDDTKVQIPREMFEARQRELAEISSLNNKHKNTKKIDDEKVENHQNSQDPSISEFNDNATTLKMILKTAIDTEISAVGETNNKIKTYVASIDEIPSLTEPSSTTRSSCIVLNPNRSPEPEIDNSVLISIPISPPMKFTLEERKRVERLVELEQSNVISFNDLEYDVASKVGVGLFLDAVASLELYQETKSLSTGLISDSLN